MLVLLLAVSLQANDSLVFHLTPASRLEVRTGKSGLLGFAGHEHTIRAREFSGRVVLYPHQPAASHVSISIVTAGLEVLTPPDTAEIRKVTAAMRTEVLDVARYPEITFVSGSVARTGDTLHMVGALSIKDQAREIAPTVQMTLSGDSLHALTTFSVKQTDFGIRPYRGGPGGTVRVANEVAFTIDAVAVRSGSP